MSRLRLLPSTARPGFQGMIGEHSRMRALFESIRRVAPLDAPVLVQGPTGTGKELVAEALHTLSGRRGRFQALNVAALTGSLVESELFGYVRGAFTGAGADRKGLIASTMDGTLYLDEAADLSPALQAKLLRVLETGMVRPVGADRERPVRFRLVISTQQPAAALVAHSRWREDFYYRVCGAVLTLPALAERPSDLAPLVDHFLAQLDRPPLPPESAACLAAYPWPGNVRELRYAIERAVFEARDEPVTAGRILEAAVWFGAPPAGTYRPGAGRTLDEVSRAYIEQVLEETAFDVGAAAEILGLSPRALYRRFAALGIIPPRRRLN